MSDGRSGHVLVLNAGSSTLKFATFDRDLEQSLAGTIDWAGGGDAATLRLAGADGGTETLAASGHGEAADAVIDLLSGHNGLRQSLIGVGHRVVHGGDTFHAPTAIDAGVRARIEALSRLAPLHNPPALAALDATAGVLDVPHVAVFDTAFFARLPPRAYLYPVPWAWYEQHGVRRYGFHGTSHAHTVSRCHELLDADSLRVVSCHLGSGCSAAAAHGMRAVATTMGFTPLEGLMMGTRPGSVDPGVLLHLAREGLSTEEIDVALNRQSGLLGISGVSADFRQVSAAAASGHERARLALELYEERIVQTVGALTAQLGGIDALCFTAGVGEHAATLRARVCERLTWLGVELDAGANDAGAGAGDVVISSAASAVRVLVIRCREERRIARETFELLQD